MNEKERRNSEKRSQSTTNVRMRIPTSASTRTSSSNNMSAKASNKTASRMDHHVRKHRSGKERSNSSGAEHNVNMLRLPVQVPLHNGQFALQSSPYHGAGRAIQVPQQPHLIAAGGKSPFVQVPYSVFAGGSGRINHPGAAVTMGLPIQPNGPSAFGTNTTGTTGMVLKPAGGEASSYKDYSLVPFQVKEEEGISAPDKVSGKDESFPVKLHQMLSDAENEEYICWLPHGRSWRIVKPKAFEAKIVPQYFKHAKYASFMRQVNGWGFKRITEGPDHNSYYHELFLRGLPQWCHKMQRPPKMKKGSSSTSNDASNTYPDFHHLSMVAPLPLAQGGPVESPQIHQAPRAFVTASPANTVASTPSNMVPSAQQFHHYRTSSANPIAPRHAEPFGTRQNRLPQQQQNRNAHLVSSSTSNSGSGDDEEVRQKRTAEANRRLADQATCSSSSSAYAGGSERGGSSGCSSDSGTDPSSDGGNQQSKLSPDDIQKEPRHKDTAAAEGDQSPSTSPSSEGEDKRKASRAAEFGRPMQQVMNGPPGAPGSTMPCIVVQMQQGGNQQQQQPIMFQQPQAQFVRVLNQNGTELGYIQVPANQAMQGQNQPFFQQGQMMQGQNPQMMQGQNPQLFQQGQMMQGQNSQMMQGQNLQLFQQGQNPQLYQQGQSPQLYQQGQNPQIFQQGQMMQGQFQQRQMMQTGNMQQPQQLQQMMQQAQQLGMQQQQRPPQQMSFPDDNGP